MFAKVLSSPYATFLEAVAVNRQGPSGPVFQIRPPGAQCSLFALHFALGEKYADIVDSGNMRHKMDSQGVINSVPKKDSRLINEISLM